MKERKRAATPVEKEDQKALFDHINAVASSTECTGLIPTPATDQEELDSYTDIYDVPLTDSPKNQFEDGDHYPHRP